MNSFLQRLSLRPVIDWIQNHNYYRRARETMVKGYLRRTVALHDQAPVITWQPLYYVVLKILIALIAMIWLYGLHTILGGWLETGFRFFKFHEIYNFTFPGRSFFDGIASAIALIILGYYGLYFLYHQLQALFSSLVVSGPEKKVFYIRSLFVRKDLHVFSTTEIDLFVLKHNLLSRPFGIGTLVLNNRSGDVITVRGIGRAGKVMKAISSAGAPAEGK